MVKLIFESGNKLGSFWMTTKYTITNNEIKDDLGDDIVLLNGNDENSNKILNLVQEISELIDKLGVNFSANVETTEGEEGSKLMEKFR